MARYLVTYSVEGLLTIPVEAENEDAAVKEADKMVPEYMDEVAWTDWEAPSVEKAKEE